jgi:pyruvate, orthophosphate dikinase
VLSALKRVEETMGKGFGDLKNPLLVSVRSGARASMPGMMDTILNLGLNDETVVGLAQSSNNERFAWDSYRRFIQMYSNVVFGYELVTSGNGPGRFKKTKRVTVRIRISLPPTLNF